MAGQDSRKMSIVTSASGSRWSVVVQRSSSSLQREQQRTTSLQLLHHSEGQLPTYRSKISRESAIASRQLFISTFFLVSTAAAPYLQGSGTHLKGIEYQVFKRYRYKLFPLKRVRRQTLCQDQNCLVLCFNYGVIYKYSATNILKTKTRWKICGCSWIYNCNVAVGARRGALTKGS